MQVFLAEMNTISGVAGDNSYEQNSNAIFNFELSNLSDFTSSANGELTFTLPSDFKLVGLGVEYTGPNKDGFDFPTTPQLEPNTIITGTQSDGSTEITISLQKLLDEDKVPVGGIPAKGSIQVTIAARVLNSTDDSFWSIPYTYSAPGNAQQSKSVVVNLGGGLNAFLPLIRR